MELPKLYKPVLIQFWSLRNGLGANLGVVFDNDTLVTRKVIRVLRGDGDWVFQIANQEKIFNYGDWNVITDQEVLNEYGSEIEFKEIKK